MASASNTGVSPPGSAGSDINNPQKPKIRTGDKDNEEIIIPKNRIFLVFIGLMLSTFLAALDMTIVCMCLRSSMY